MGLGIHKVGNLQGSVGLGIHKVTYRVVWG